MRLLIVGTLNGQLTTATKIAMDKGATVTHAADIAQALAVLRSGRGADLLMVDVALDIRDLVARLEAEHIHVPIVACGTGDRRARRGRRHPCRRQGIHPAAAGRGTDRRGARRRRRRQPRIDLPRRRHGARHQARPADRAERGLGSDHRRIRHRQGGAGALRARPLEPRQEAVHLRQLRRHPGAAPGIRIVRPREGRLHRRGGAAGRQIRGGERRHAPARRNLRDGGAAAGQAVARDPGARHRPRRRRAAGVDRHPHPRHLQPQSRRGGARRQFPRGSAVPAQRRQSENPAAARAAGRRDRTGAIFHPEIRRRERRAGAAACRRRRAARSASITGRAMCANWRTPCTAPC